MKKQLNIEKISYQLEQLGLNQAKIAQNMGVSRESVSKWFRHEKFPRPAKLLRLGLELKLPLDELTTSIASSNDPIVAFRRKARRNTTDAHVKQAQRMGNLLEELVNYLPFNKFEYPPTLKDWSTGYDYIQSVAAEVRRGIGRNQTDVLEFGDLIDTFYRLQAILIPVMWGEREHHENALHVYLPASMSTWVYLNIDSKIHDFKFWMAHELGHVYIRTEQGDDAEDFADLFAQALLFPKDSAKQAYRQLAKIVHPGAQVNRIKSLAETHEISPFTVYCAINSYAKAFNLPEIGLEAIHGATTNFNKAYPSLLESLTPAADISVSTYLRHTQDSFRSPFFAILQRYLFEREKSANFIQAVLGIPLLDAKAIYEELTRDAASQNPD